MFIFLFENRESVQGVPCFEECSFGYYEWFAKEIKNTITISKVAVLAPFKKVISDDSYELEIKYSPILKGGRYLSRYEAYELVREYWKPSNLNYMRIKVDEREGSTIFLPYTKDDYELERNQWIEKFKLKLKLENERNNRIKESKINYNFEDNIV